MDNTEQYTRDECSVVDKWIGVLRSNTKDPLPEWSADDGVSAMAWAKTASIEPEAQLRGLAQVLEVAFIENLSGQPASTQFIETIPIGFAREHTLLGLTDGDDALRVVVGDIDSWPMLDVVARRLGCSVEPVFAPPSAIQSAINHAYQQRSGQAQSLIDRLDHDEVLAELGQLTEKHDLLDVDDRAPVIRLVNLVLFEAVKAGASDVHIQPYEDRLVIRQRIDGVLFDAFDVPKNLQEEVVSRIKVIGRMNIAEKRLPQDGRATVQVGDQMIDLRIASLPTSYGERAVIRILDKSARLYTLRELGMEEKTRAQFQELIRLEHGLILVTGPTGSGKSTTLYAALQEINTKRLNVVTLEDPIEYQLDGISQTQISEKKGMTFASGLRSVLRQDPDIIMVGEIRDEETAMMAVQSALTGHLVFSTLHTNDAASAVTRLIDLGIEPYLVASSMIGVLAQRLVRNICGQCATPQIPSTDQLRRLNLEHPSFKEGSFWKGAGCPSCRDTGYDGRVGIFELLVVDEGVRDKIHAKSSASEIRAQAEAAGMRLLRDDGVAKILTRETTLDEIVRVTMRSTL